MACNLSGNFMSLKVLTGKFLSILCWKTEKSLCPNVTNDTASHHLSNYSAVLDYIPLCVFKDFYILWKASQKPKYQMSLSRFTAFPSIWCTRVKLKHQEHSHSTSGWLFWLPCNKIRLKFNCVLAISRQIQILNNA